MKFYNHLLKNRKAFTLVEILIVIAISALLSTIVIAYSSLSKNEVSVSIEEAKISQFLFQAKTLAMATYAVSSSTCGYGVYFDYTAGTYSIFAYTPNFSSCPDASTVSSSTISTSDIQKYTDSTWNVHLTKGVQFQQNADSASIILFYPPNPTTLISLNGYSFANGASSSIYLFPAGNSLYVNHISVNSSGQITM